MINFFKIKQKIGELIEKYQDEENVSDSIDFNNDNQYVCISFQKSDYSKKINIDVRTSDYVYKFYYPSDFTGRYDMSKLEHVSSIPSKLDD